MTSTNVSFIAKHFWIQMLSLDTTNSTTPRCDRDGKWWTTSCLLRTLLNTGSYPQLNLLLIRWFQFAHFLQNLLTLGSAYRVRKLWGRKWCCVRNGVRWTAAGYLIATLTFACLAEQGTRAEGLRAVDTKLVAVQKMCMMMHRCFQVSLSFPFFLFLPICPIQARRYS